MDLHEPPDEPENRLDKINQEKIDPSYAELLAELQILRQQLEELKTCVGSTRDVYKLVSAANEAFDLFNQFATSHTRINQNIYEIQARIRFVKTRLAELNYNS